MGTYTICDWRSMTRGRRFSWERSGTCEHYFHVFDLSMLYRIYISRQDIREEGAGCHQVSTSAGASTKKLLDRKMRSSVHTLVACFAWLSIHGEPFCGDLARAIEVCSTFEVDWAVSKGLSGSTALCRNANLRHDRPLAPKEDQSNLRVTESLELNFLQSRFKRSRLSMLLLRCSL